MNNQTQKAAASLIIAFIGCSLWLPLSKEYAIAYIVLNISVIVYACIIESKWLHIISRVFCVSMGALAALVTYAGHGH